MIIAQRLSVSLDLVGEVGETTRKPFSSCLFWTVKPEAAPLVTRSIFCPITAQVGPRDVKVQLGCPQRFAIHYNRAESTLEAELECERWLRYLGTVMLNDIMRLRRALTKFVAEDQVSCDIFHVMSS